MVEKSIVFTNETSLDKDRAKKDLLEALKKIEKEGLKIRGFNILCE